MSLRLCVPSPPRQLPVETIEQVEDDLTNDVIPTVDLEYQRAQMRTPLPFAEEEENGIVLSSPILVIPILEKEPDDDDGASLASPILVVPDLQEEPRDVLVPKGKKGHRMKPRNLFNSGVSIKRFNIRANLKDSESEKDDPDDSDVFFFVPSEEDDDLEYDEDDPIAERKCFGKKRSSYSGIRGPKADAKALSLVTNCPVSVKWLVDNFEYCPGRSLPRGFVYDQYVLLCNESGLEPVNAASFGKLIRSVFPGLKTRRLGTRGNSKYHYNGVYLKKSSPLMVILNLLKTQQGLSYDGNGKRGRRVRRVHDGLDETTFRYKESEDLVDCTPEEYLGRVGPSEDMLSWILIDCGAEVLPPDLDVEMILVFQSMYRAHCKQILRYFEKFDLRMVCDEWKRFWRIQCQVPEPAEGMASYRDIMSKATLFKVCTLKVTQRYVMDMDLCTYQGAIEVLFPSVARGMPITMANTMRSFMKDVEFVLFKLMDGYPKGLAEKKLRGLHSFMIIFNDYTRLNRMLKTAVSTVRSADSIDAMRSELARSMNFLDLEKRVECHIKETEALVQDKLVLAFRLNLHSVQPENVNQALDMWIEWAEQISEKLVSERNRQHMEQEVRMILDPYYIWQRASNQIMGSIVKGSAVTFSVFKGFLIWCDALIKQFTKLNLARREGYSVATMYYETTLENNARVTVIG